MNVTVFRSDAPASVRSLLLLPLPPPPPLLPPLLLLLLGPRPPSPAPAMHVSGLCTETAVAG
jgi:hypothetical protein